MSNKKGIGPRHLGASPLKQTKKQQQEYDNLTKREEFQGFNTDNDTLIIGRSNSTSGATFSNNAKRRQAVQKNKINGQVKKSVMLKFGKDGQFKYVTQHKKT